jgi:hypothetical protein
MVKHAWLLLALSAPVFCQSPESGNAAQALFERRIQSMRLVTPAELRKPRTPNYVGTTNPPVCAIGLTPVQPGGVEASRMPVLRPSEPPLKGDVTTTMPVCGE